MSDLPSNASRFDDGKAPDAMRTIGEVSAAFDIKPDVLRYWEAQFPTLKPLKRSGGRRLYRAEDIALIETIDRLVNREGYTLKGARKALREGTTETVATKDNDVEVLPRLRAIRSRLAGALDD